MSTGTDWVRTSVHCPTYLQNTGVTPTQGVSTALEQWRRSDQQAHIYRDRVLAPAISAQERSQKAYSAGKSSLRVVLATQHNRFIAERSLLAHEAEATTDLINLERTVGGSFELPLERPRVETSPPEDDAEDLKS